uniref:Chondroitin proteoglycan 4 domain-containing protein n=2 Tax=Parascaris univalens TaxID=6257 RepID=A0A914ZJD1_PARUN
IMTASLEYFVQCIIGTALFILFSTCSASNINDIMSLTNLFKFSPQSDCLDECATPLVVAVYDMVAYGNSRTHFGDLCIEYSSALTCFEKNAEQCRANIRLFKLVTSGLDIGCDSDRAVFDSAFACVDVFRDKPLSECERSCHLYGGLSNWTSSKYMKTLPAGGESALLLSLRDAATFCSGLSCYLSCAQTHLNFMCGEDGERILELFTRPLQEMARHYRAAPAEQKALLRSIAIPDECAKIVHIQNEDHLIFNEGVLRDVNVNDFFSDLMLDNFEKSKKRKPDSDYFDLSLLNIDTADREANGLQKNTNSVAYVVLTFIFVFFVLFVTLLGLVVTVMWCCVTTRKSRRKMTYALRFISAVSPPVKDSSIKSPAQPPTVSKDK